MNNIILETKNLTKTFGGYKAVELGEYHRIRR